MKCTYLPSKGVNLFKQLKKQYGYHTAKEVFLRAINPRFIKDNKNTLSLDAEGVPTFESLMSNSWMKSFIGDELILKSLNTYSPKEDTIDNYKSLIEEARAFNTTSPYKDSFIATVEYTEDNQIVIQISKYSQGKAEQFNNQYGVVKLNESLARIFGSLGVTVGNLTAAEVSSGRVGHIDFSKARDMASGFNSMIRVANNMEGATAISEEFSHLMIEIFKNDSLVVRGLNAIMNEESLKKILGDSYQDVFDYHNGNLTLVAEEALGQLLQKNLLTTSLEEYKHKSLFKRVIDYIVNKFKNFKTSDVDAAIQDADNAMNQLAKNILTNTVQVTKEDVVNINRNDSFNSLSDRVERNVNILKGAIEVELKRYKINEDVDPTSISTNISNLRRFTNKETDTVLGLMTYAKTAIANLKYLYNGFSTLNEKSINDRSKYLRKVQQYLQSYGDFIGALNTALNEEETLENNMFIREIEIDGFKFNLKSLIEELNSLSVQLENKFKNTAIPMFAEFCKPYLEGTGIVVEELIKRAESDISFLDRWIDSMGTSSDVLLQVFDMSAKKAKDAARFKTIDTIKKIQAWRIKAENAGITDFEKFFEKDSSGRKTGNYISAVNLGEFEYQKNLFLEELNKKYGKNPSGEQAKQKIAEKNEWMKKYAIVSFGRIYPNPTMWENKEYTKLSDTEKAIFKEFTDLKAELDRLLPEKKINSNMAIQMRKSSGQRFITSVTSPSKLFENIKEGFKSSFYDSADDDQIFGATVRKGLTNFDGSEFMVLPLNYTSKLNNQEELSTDLAATLMAYAYMANQYNELEKIVNPLEIGRTIVKQYRDTKKTRGSNPLIEKVDALGDVVYRDILHAEGTNIAKKLDDFMESQIYQRYIKDEGVIGKFNIAKTVNKALEASSLAQLGFNWLANLANVTQGICMQHIEVAAKQYFTAGELLSADKEYASLLKDYIPEVGARVQNSKMALLGEFFNIKQDFKGKVKRSNKKNILERLFGADIAFLGQECGDHWLYYRTAIAHMKHTKIKVDGKETTVWDALQVRDSKVGRGIKEMYMPEAYNLDGSKFDVAKFGRRIAHINHTLFGVYNDEDANAANRVALGRLLMQYRKWMKPLFNRRFQKKQYVLEMDATEEGYYRTLIRVAQQLKRGEVQFGMLKEQLSEEDFSNVKRALWEIIQFLAVMAASQLINWPDDKDRPWALKLAEYTTHRLAHELGGLTPSPAMINETLKTVKTPLAILSTAQNAVNLATSIIDPRDWVDEIQSGPYKGMSTLEKNFIKAPIPGVAQFRQIQKFVGDLDTSMMYYLRPY